jgi:hypothetical protein
LKGNVDRSFGCGCAGLGQGLWFSIANHPCCLYVQADAQPQTCSSLISHRESRIGDHRPLLTYEFLRLPWNVIDNKRSQIAIVSIPWNVDENKRVGRINPGMLLISNVVSLFSIWR